MICRKTSARALIAIVAMVLLLLAGNADAIPVLQWSKTFSDDLYAVQQTSDGGYILAGRTDSFGAGDSDIWLIKTNGDGDMKWSKTFGRKWTEAGMGFVSVQQTTDSGFVLASGTCEPDSRSSYFNCYAWLIKTDKDGELTWDKTFDKSTDAYDVKQTFDGGYIIAGSFDTNSAWLIKVNTIGNLEWSKIFDEKEGSYYRFESVQQTADGGYILVGAITKVWDVWEGRLIKTDARGNQQWKKTFETRISSGQQTTDGGYIFVRDVYPFGHETPDIKLSKIDANGNPQWSKTYGGTSYEYSRAVQQTSDDGYVILGETGSYGTGSRNAWLIKTDINGNEQWNMTFSGTLYAKAVQQTSDRGYILVGNECIDTCNSRVIKVSEKFASITPSPIATNIPTTTPKPTITSIPDNNKIVEAANQYSKLFSSEFWYKESQERANAYLKSYTDPLSVTLKSAKSIFTSAVGAAKMNSAAGIIDNLGQSYSSLSATANQGLLSNMDIKAKGIGGNTLSEEFTILANLLKENKDPKQQLVVVSNKIELYRDMLKNPEKYDVSVNEWSDTVKMFPMNKNILLSMFNSAQEFIDALKINYGMEVQTISKGITQPKKTPAFEALVALLLLIIVYRIKRKMHDA